jgi:hypothetical protein
VKTGQHLHPGIRGPSLDALKLPTVYLRLVGKFFLRQTLRHPQPVDVPSKDLPPI